MESWPLRRWAPPGPLAAPLAAPWLLGLLLSPWTLRLTGICLPSPRSLALHFRAAFIPPPALIPVSGDLLLRLNIADFTGKPPGPGAA